MGWIWLVLAFILPGNIYWFVKRKERFAGCAEGKKDAIMQKRMMWGANIIALLVTILGLLATFVF